MVDAADSKSAGDRTDARKALLKNDSASSNLALFTNHNTILEKLELRHLAGYLEHGLKVKATQYENYIGEIDILYRNKVRLTNSEAFNFENIKPLVIPLSQLTKEQWQQVFEAGCPQFADEFSVEVTENWVTINRCYDISTFDFRYRNFNISHRMPPFDALAAFEKLYSLHADLRGLIPAGLGLNKLDILNKEI